MSGIARFVQLMEKYIGDGKFFFFFFSSKKEKTKLLPFCQSIQAHVICVGCNGSSSIFFSFFFFFFFFFSFL
jgi:hypothetical protein